MLHDDLLRQASSLVTPEDSERSEADLRRAISSAYYAVFHAIGFHVAREMLGSSPGDAALRALVRRAVDHTELREALRGYASGNLKPIYKQVVGDRKNADLRIIADEFTSLQHERHKADYDVAWQVNLLTAQAAVTGAEKAIAALERLATQADQAIFQKLFMVSVLFHNTLKRRA